MRLQDHEVYDFPDQSPREGQDNIKMPFGIGVSAN
jgi:hypothetical protein